MSVLMILGHFRLALFLIIIVFHITDRSDHYQGIRYQVYRYMCLSGHMCTLGLCYLRGLDHVARCGPGYRLHGLAHVSSVKSVLQQYSSTM